MVSHSQYMLQSCNVGLTFLRLMSIICTFRDEIITNNKYEFWRKCMYQSAGEAAICYFQSCFHNNSDIDLHILDTTQSDIINKITKNHKLVSPFLSCFFLILSALNGCKTQLLNLLQVWFKNIHQTNKITFKESSYLKIFDFKF